MKISGSANEQKSEKINYRHFLISGLKKEIESARKLDPEKLATEIRQIGFSCQYCGKCCRRAFGDNRVMLIPPEIEIIREFTGLSKLEIAGPFVPDKDEDLSSSEFLEFLQENTDFEGNIHVFGWILRRKKNGDCVFLGNGTDRCRVYPVRPMLCRTYPFYLEALELHTCECEGLGYPITTEESRKMAEYLLLRYISELEDTLVVYENYIDFRRGEGNGPDIAKISLEKSSCIYAVHDSTGVTKIVE
jgi:uncharacterized protein